MELLGIKFNLLNAFIEITLILLGFNIVIKASIRRKKLINFLETKQRAVFLILSGAIVFTAYRYIFIKTAFLVYFFWMILSIGVMFVILLLYIEPKYTWIEASPEEIASYYRYTLIDQLYRLSKKLPTQCKFCKIIQYCIVMGIIRFDYNNYRDNYVLGCLKRIKYNRLNILAEKYQYDVSKIQTLIAYDSSWREEYRRYSSHPYFGSLEVPSIDISSL